MKLVANSVTKTTKWLPFLLLSNTVHEIREKIFPRVNSEIKIREHFPAKPEKSKFRELNSHENLRPRGFWSCGSCERFCFSCNLSAFVSRFKQSRIRDLRKFCGAESHAMSVCVLWSLPSQINTAQETRRCTVVLYYRVGIKTWNCHSQLGTRNITFLTLKKK